MKSDSVLRPIFGAYINLARNNFFSTLKYINTCVGATGGIDNNEAQIYKMSILSVPLTPEQEDKARRLFFLHFPFVKYHCADKDELIIPFSTLRNTLKACANVLSWWRNIYSHSNAKERVIDPADPKVENNYIRIRKDEEEIVKLMINAMTVSARIIKERYSSKNKSQEGMLASDSMEFITKDRYALSRDRERKLELNRRHFLCPLSSGQSLPDGSNPDRLSDSGKIQFVCLFLEKKYITEFLSQTHFLSKLSYNVEAPRLSQARLAMDTISALRIRLPESRLRTDRDEMQVALDILGEMRKCPAEIYNLLSEEDKATFMIQSSLGESVLLRRNSDRFVPLTLSYFDTTKAFSKLRFQVNTGTLRFLFKENKKCIDGQLRMRVLQKPLNGFGRIQEVEKQRVAEDRHLWSEYKILGFDDSARNDKSCLPYISDVFTRYIINGDNIGIRLNGEALPEIKLREDGTHYDVNCPQADCIISRFNLPAMLFYHILTIKKNNSSDVEERILEYVKRYRRFFLDIADGKITPFRGPEAEKQLSQTLNQTYGIELRDIPDKIKEYLLDKTENSNRFERHKEFLISEMLKETEFSLNRILKQKETVEGSFAHNKCVENKPGKKNYVQIKPGNLASYLVKDIVLFQDCENKMTGMNYSVMQGAIARFSAHDPSGKDELKKIFKRADLISQDERAGSHPFLWQIVNDPMVNSTVTFYIKYLRAKIDYLKGAIPNSALFLHSARKRWEERNKVYYTELAKRYLSQPIMLSTNVFEKPVRDLLRDCKNAKVNEKIESALKSGNCNMTYMIQLYQDIILEDGPQCFYGLTEGDMEHSCRLYPLVRKYSYEARRLKDHSGGVVFKGILSNALSWAESNPERCEKTKSFTNKPTYKEICSIIRSAYKEYTETEKKIRRLATQDSLLFMAASSLIKTTLALPETDDSMKLYLIGRPSKKNILDKKLPKLIKNVSFGWKDLTDNNIPETYKAVNIETSEMCIKDYGDIYKIINDRRVASLIHHLNISSITLEDLRKEIESFDKKRVSVFENLFEYEDKVLKASDIKPERFEFDAIQQLDKKNSPVDKFVTKLLRNSFCHNFYPTRIAGSREKNLQNIVVIEKDVPKVAESMAQKISDFSKQSIK